MNTVTTQKRKGYVVIGCGGLLLAAGYFAMSLNLPFGQIDRPGAAIFPLLVSILLMIASLATVWEGWKAATTATAEFPAGADRWRLLGMVAILTAYVIILPWLGQLLGGMLFCLALMRLLSHLSWPRIFAWSSTLSLAVYMVFVILLRVPMPRGILAF